MPKCRLLCPLAALAGLTAALTVQAESHLVTSAAGGMAAQGQLGFRVVIPEVLLMRVSSGIRFATTNSVAGGRVNEPLPFNSSAQVANSLSLLSGRAVYTAALP